MLAFGSNVVPDIAALNGTMNSGQYCPILTNWSLPFASVECTENWIFQQDKPSCRKSKYTMEFLSDNYIETLRSPARSRD